MKKHLPQYVTNGLRKASKTQTELALISDHRSTAPCAAAIDDGPSPAV